MLLEKLLSYTKDAEAGLLGYAATKDDMYLKRGETVRTSLDNTFRGLDSLTQEGDSLQKHLAEIRLRYNNSLDSLSELKTHQPALAMSNLHGLQALRSQINGLMTAEDKLLQQRNLAYKKEATLTPYIAFLLLAFSMLKFLISFYVINNDYRKINRVSNELKLMNDSFNTPRKSLR
ncbi:MAG: CHASE3 domain-containing protein [Chitinophagales bacterium]